MNKGLNNLMDMANKLASNVAESVEGLHQAKNSIKQHIPDEYSEDYRNLMNISYRTKKAFNEKGAIDPNDLLKELKEQERKINDKVKKEKDAS